MRVPLPLPRAGRRARLKRRGRRRESKQSKRREAPVVFSSFDASVFLFLVASCWLINPVTPLPFRDRGQRRAERAPGKWWKGMNEASRGSKARKRKNECSHFAFHTAIDALSSFSLSSFLLLSLSPLPLLVPMHWSTGLRVTSPPTMARTSPALSWAMAFGFEEEKRRRVFFEVEEEEKIKV